jgi:hypothetical protein
VGEAGGVTVVVLVLVPDADEGTGVGVGVVVVGDVVVLAALPDDGVVVWFVVGDAELLLEVVAGVELVVPPCVVAPTAG